MLENYGKKEKQTKRVRENEPPSSKLDSSPMKKKHKNTSRRSSSSGRPVNLLDVLNSLASSNSNKNNSSNSEDDSGLGDSDKSNDISDESLVLAETTKDISEGQTPASSLRVKSFANCLSRNNISEPEVCVISPIPVVKPSGRNNMVGKLDFSWLSKPIVIPEDKMETSTLDDSIQEVEEEKTDKMDDDIQVVEAVTLEEKTDKVDDSIQEVDDEVIPEKTKLVKDNDSAITLEEDVDNDDDDIQEVAAVIPEKEIEKTVDSIWEDHLSMKLRTSTPKHPSKSKVIEEEEDDVIEIE